ncbi:MAG: erythronate-4-phosphate dehydrogenase [Porticoccaceae bacterium]|nr:MAG: erythronate-4-phosphate dehydrogenase [Porticoccaceae bacterium]
MSGTLRILADEALLGLRELFAPLGALRTAPGRAIDRRLAEEADVLLVRSVTRVDRALLEGTPVRFVGSATAGTDHVDVRWLAAAGIAFAHAPGCNAQAVANYVLCALARTVGELWGRRVAVVGCGQVGGRVYRELVRLGARVVCYDPFLAPASQPDLVDFAHALEAEILCLHTPLTRDGPHPTWRMFSAGVLARLRPGTLLLNAGRGEVVEEEALLDALRCGRLRAVLDVWPGEPAIGRELLERVELGTPHIAGYSLEGRLRGSFAIRDALCRHLQIAPPPAPSLAELAERLAGPAPAAVPLEPAATLADRLLARYDPAKDDAALRRGARPGGDLAAHFDRLRRAYPLRREFELG